MNKQKNVVQVGYPLGSIKKNADRNLAELAISELYSSTVNDRDRIIEGMAQIRITNVELASLICKQGGGDLKIMCRCKRRRKHCITHASLTVRS